MKASIGQISAAIDTPASAVRLFLLHGPDEAAARDLAVRLGRRMGEGAERVDITPAMLKANPGLLADEAAAISLFGGEARYIRVTGAGDDCTEACELLLTAPAAGNPVVVIAPALKATSRLVKLAQGSPDAMACALYVPEGADAARLVAAMAREYGLRTMGEAAALIAEGAGGDRGVIACELEKFADFLDAAPDRPRELDEAVIATIGAAISDDDMAPIINAALEGQMATLGEAMAQLESAGGGPIPLLRALVRRLMALAEMRAAIDAGGDANALLAQIFFKERAVTGRALRQWRAASIAAAIDRLREAERALMASGGPGTIIARQALLAVAQAARRGA